MRPTRRLGLNDGFEVKNGHRADLHRAYGLDAAAIAAAVREGRG
jgi:transketolase C-terminal domain/subunit